MSVYFDFRFGRPDSGLRAWLSYFGTTRAVTRKIERLMAAEKVSLLHVQCVGPNGLYALRVSKGMGLPLVITTQGEITMDAPGSISARALPTPISVDSAREPWW